MNIMVKCPGCGMHNILEDSEGEKMVISRTVTGECGGCHKMLILKLELEQSGKAEKGKL